MRALALLLQLFASHNLVAAILPLHINEFSKLVSRDGVEASDHFLNHGENVSYWCDPYNLTDPDVVVNLWEHRGVGEFLGIWTQPCQSEKCDERLGPDEWPYHLVEAYVEHPGDTETGGCGIVSGSCALAKLNCTTMVLAGNGTGGQAYWALQAVKGFHAKLDMIHEKLQDTTLQSWMQIDEIKDDFSEKDKWARVKEMMSLLGSTFYMAGSFAGTGSIALTKVGAAATARVAAIQGKKATARSQVKKLSDEIKNWEKKGKMTPEEHARRVKENQDKIKELNVKVAEYTSLIAKEQARADKLKKSLDKGADRGATFGSVAYLMGSSFGITNQFIKADDSEQVDATKLKNVLNEMFDGVRSNLEHIGGLATGRGGEYAELPHANGTGPVPLGDEMYVAGFFADGKYLLGEASQDYKDYMEDSFKMWTPKVVDMALKTVGYQILHLYKHTTEEKCKKLEYPGSRWVVIPKTNKGYCMGMWKKNPTSQSTKETPCPWDGRTCNMTPAQDRICKAMEEKYNMNVNDYYVAAFMCNQYGKDGAPDLENLPDDGSVMPCYVGLELKNGDDEGKSCNKEYCPPRFEMRTSDFKP